MRTTLAFLTAAALAPLALAQTSAQDDGCEQANPCPWVADVDDKGFQSYVEKEVTFSQGDWYELLVFNDDLNRSHTLTLSGHDLSITVPADGMSEDSEAFQFTTVGTFTLRDSPTNDEVIVHVVEGDAVGGSTSTSGGDAGIPALPSALLVATLLGIAALRRR